jgi:hypothetical protein
VQGVRDNQLVGYGLVMGLQGTGDTMRNSQFTEQSLQSMLDRMGVNVRDIPLRTRNVAAVTVTADLPPFDGTGSRIDVTSLGDATRPLDLIKDFGHLGTFDIVYCRHVLIHFEKPTKADVLQRLAHAMAPDGALLLGAAGTVIGLTDALSPDPFNRGLYGKMPAVTATLPRLAALR